MHEERPSRRIVRKPSAAEAAYYQQALQEELAGMEENKARAREFIRMRRSLTEAAQELKSIRHSRDISLADVSQQCGLSIDELTQLERAAGPALTIDALRLYAEAIDHHIEIAVVANG